MAPGLSPKVRKIVSIWDIPVTYIYIYLIMYTGIGANIVRFDFTIHICLLDSETIAGPVEISLVDLTHVSTTESR